MLLITEIQMTAFAMKYLRLCFLSPLTAKISHREVMLGTFAMRGA